MIGCSWTEIHSLRWLRGNGHRDLRPEAKRLQNFRHVPTRTFADQVRIMNEDLWDRYRTAEKVSMDPNRRLRTSSDYIVTIYADRNASGMVEAMKIIHQREGFKGFARGLAPRVLTFMPSNALCWLVSIFNSSRLQSNQILDFLFSSLAFFLHLLSSIVIRRIPFLPQ